MDQNENSEETTQDINFGKEIAKSFVLSTAVSAGTFAGILVIGLAVGKFLEIKDARQAKKDAQTED